MLPTFMDLPLENTAEPIVTSIALLCLESPPSSWRLLEWAAELSLPLKAKVDLGIIASSNLIYLKEAVLKGEQVFHRSSRPVDEYLATHLGLYLSFRESRRPVEEAYIG
jgi:hypothetical protein